jgi:hypothetical protein
MSACAQQEQAACHTIDSPKTGPEVSCFATPDECVRAITTLRSRKSTSKISDCIAW